MKSLDEFDLIDELAYHLYNEACFENTYGRSDGPPEYVNFAKVTPEELNAFLKRSQDRWEKNPDDPEKSTPPDFAVWEKIVEEHGLEIATIAYLEMIHDHCPIEIQEDQWPGFNKRLEQLKQCNID
jgi:hypothetical protein